MIIENSWGTGYLLEEHIGSFLFPHLGGGDTGICLPRCLL